MKRDEYLILTAAVLALAITGCSMTPGITTDGKQDCENALSPIVFSDELSVSD